MFLDTLGSLIFLCSSSSLYLLYYCYDFKYLVLLKSMLLNINQLKNKSRQQENLRIKISSQFTKYEITLS